MSMADIYTMNITVYTSESVFGEGYTPAASVDNIELTYDAGTKTLVPNVSQVSCEVKILYMKSPVEYSIDKGIEICSIDISELIDPLGNDIALDFDNEITRYAYMTLDTDRQTDIIISPGDEWTAGQTVNVPCRINVGDGLLSRDVIVEEARSASYRSTNNFLSMSNVKTEFRIPLRGYKALGDPERFR